MSQRSRILPHLWLSALVGACGFWLWLTYVRIERVEYVTHLVPTDAVVDPSSPTGYAHGMRQLIVPGHDNASCQWIAQTQQMLAQGDWRVRHEDYDNAPFGREVLSPSPYRWWLGLVSGVDHLVFGTPVGRSVTRAALVADPGLQLLLLAGAALFVAWRFGKGAAAVGSVAIVTLYPLAGLFLPGRPDDGGLAAICAFWSVLLLVAGARLGVKNPSDGDPGPRRRRWFAMAGLVGGIGLWIKPAVEVPVLSGIALGGILVAWLARRATPGKEAAPGEPWPWRTWALAGAATCLGAFLIEFFPSHLGGWHVEEVHPLYGLAWLGGGEWLVRICAWIERRPGPRLFRSLAILIVAAIPVAVLAILAFSSGHRDLILAETGSARLTRLAASPEAPNFWSWFHRSGWSLGFVATFLPLLAAGGAAGWALRRSPTAAAVKAAVALALGPVLVGLLLGFFFLSWWNVLDLLLVALLIAVIPAIEHAAIAGPRRLAALGVLVLCLTPGVLVLAQRAWADTRKTATDTDVEALIDRDLAQWLANASGGHAVVLAPPALTTSLYFNGGLAGLGSPDVENRAGLMASIRIAGASSPDEAQALARGRHLKYIVVPSWDDTLDAYARLGTNQYGHSLMALLHHWLPPRWLRPVPYHLPKVTGFEGQSVAIFEVVDVEDNATALSHLAEYFVEMDRIGNAVGVAYTLAHSFPTNLSAAVARVLVARAAGNSSDFKAALDEVQASLARGEDKSLPWDRRVSLAIALVEGKRFELAKAQVQRCLAGVTEARLRSLTTVSLYRLQVMGKAFGLRIVDPRLRRLAENLLPDQLRNRP